MKPTSITIVGLGSVGSALLHVFTKESLPVRNVYNRSEVPVSIQNKYSETRFTQSLNELNFTAGQPVFITVSDDAIADTVARLSEGKQDLADVHFVHCSGTHASQILAPLQEKGAKVASFHPMKAITRKTVSFKDIWFDMEGDRELLEELEQIAHIMEAKTFEVLPKAKPLLHASAVVASNYLVVLAELVTRITGMGEVSPEHALQAMMPLMQNTLQNVEELGVTDALTGPIARGDVETIQQHIKSMQANSELLMLYKTLGLEAVKIAERKSGETASLKEIKKLLE